ncbi:ATP-binding protein, partial [Pricia sp.]|uniref:ATP-binding protein n=1 Tax=Pricia sp. TaxID=2268138 RepID=UPI0035933800
MNGKIRVFVFLVQCFVGGHTIAQKPNNDPLPENFKEVGLPYIQNYTPDDYGKAHAQNWAVAQDSLGILYFANGDGVMMYDGVTWDVIGLPKISAAKSIAIDRHNRVYAGASGEFGYLEPDSLGRMKYVSLSALLKKKEQNFTTIWQIHAVSDGIYFQSEEFLFRWADGHFKAWKSQSGFKFSFLFSVNNKLYVNIRGEGLMHLAGDAIKLIPHGEFFKDRKITTILPYERDQLLIGTPNGFLIYKNGEVIPYKTDLDDFIKQNKLYTGLQLNNGSYVLGTLNGGLAVMDGKGRQLLLLDKEKTLASLSVHKLYQDGSGILWAALGNGLAKIEYPSPFSTYDHLGVTSHCSVITRFQNNLYAGTRNGLFRLVTDGANGTLFENVQGIKDHIWDLLVFDNMLLIAWEDGVYQLKNGEIRPIGHWNPSAFHRSSLDPNRVFISLADGLGSIYYKEGHWLDEGLINGVQGSTYAIIEEASGNLWLETGEDWIWRVSFKTRGEALKLKAPKCEKFGTAQGLPEEQVVPYQVNGTVFCVSFNERETFELDTNSNRFHPDHTLNKALGIPGKPIFVDYVDADENIIFRINNNDEPTKRFIAWLSGSGKYKIENLKEERIADNLVQTWYVETKDSIIWQFGDKGIVRHDVRVAKNDKYPFTALLKKVIYKRDSLLIAGAYSSQTATLPFKNNSFRFAYASPSFYREDINRFQYNLEGLDEKWSGWNFETQKDYNNLPEGNYTFKVRAKNIFGQISNEDSYKFTILNPWFRTWWAYMGYLLAAIVLLWLFAQWRSRQLRHKNLALEALIEERTEEIRKKNELLGHQTEKLKEMDTMKTRLFANISHEFRTPLTLIKGPIEKLEEAKENTLSTLNIKMIRRNANRLLKLVNQLLDLSKLDSGKLQLDLAEGDVFKCIRAAASSFSSHAAQRQMDYQIKVPSSPLWASFDRDKLEKIVYNLLSNDFKFTPDEAKVIIRANYGNDRLQLTVSDSGHGIEKEKLPHIFDRFYQVDSSYTKEKSGTGIGLALTKELVELFSGEIYVESEPDKGSIFKVIVPLEKIRSYKNEEPEEIASSVFDEVDDLGEMADVEISQRNIKVLIIEDNHDMRHFIKEQLMGDYEVLEAVNGKDGLAKAGQIVPDLIITDLMMPQMDGITLCK